GGTADRNRSHWSTSKTPSYTKSVSWQHHPQWLKSTVEKMHDKEQFSESALENMVTLSAKSQEYLTRATQRYYGKTPMQIINEIRINFAKKQLEMTNYSVTDIAFEAGYSSPSLFIKTFKKLTSFTPKSYRKKLTEFNQ
ncbi:helix-turn-helix domain-containing protein, partial [Escherichia coli]|nr:helix-turn-helix domain-containing protein [Escherichia coli]